MVIFHGELSVYPGDDPSDASLGEKTMGIRLGDGAGVGSKGSQDIAETTKKNLGFEDAILGFHSELMGFNAISRDLTDTKW